MTEGFLILGAMPENAVPDKYLAAGPWCFYKQEERFPDWRDSFRFAPEPLANAANLQPAARAAQALALRLVREAAAWLLENQAQKDSRLPDEYWQILLLPWLIEIASLIVDRTMRCKAMVEIWGDTKLEVPLATDCVFSFSDEQDFILRGAMNVSFNFWLFSVLLEKIWPAAWKKVFVKCEISSREPSPQKSALREKARELALRMPFPKMKGMSFSQSLKFSLALAHPCRSDDRALDIHKTFDFKSDLEKIIPSGWTLDAIWQKAMPESIKRLSHKPIKKSKLSRTKFAALAFHENAAYRQRLAYWRASGNRLAFCQHGGNYGEVATPCAASVTEYAQQAFFTWGWKKQDGTQANFIPAPSPQLCGLAHKWHGKNSGDLVFVGTEMPVFCHRLDSHPTPLQYLAYRDAKKIFFDNLPEKILENSFYRPYFHLPGTWEDAPWLCSRFPELKICAGDLLPRILSCRLLVLDHHGTTLLEAMSADVPFIAYWNRNFWPLCQEFAYLIELMKNCGIWHETPQSAAKHAREIWDDCIAWWNSEKCVEARSVFRQRQAWITSSPDQSWIKLLKNL